METNVKFWRIARWKAENGVPYLAGRQLLSPGFHQDVVHGRLRFVRGGQKNTAAPLDKTDKAAILDTDIKTGALGGIPG